MKTDQRKSVVWLGGGILVAGLLPLLLYWLMLGHVDAWTTLLNGQAPMFRASSIFEQWVVVITAVGVKPTYMLISLGTVIWLWRRQSPDLAALRWGLIAFWLGEAACAVNYVILQGYSDLWEYFHNFGMAVSFSFVTYALLEGMDRRLIKYNSAKDRCAALNLCRACIKYADAPCGLRRMFAMLIPATIVVAVMPLCADLKTAAFDTVIMGKSVYFSETLSNQLFEIRYCPCVALLLLTASWLVLLFKRQDPVPLAKALFAAATGPMGFGFMRLFLAAAYRENPVWANGWEEITELIFTAAVAFILFIFRQSLFAKEPPDQTSPTGAQEALA
jgi:hypothetical protein